MNDSTFPQESNGESRYEDVPLGDDAPQFGAVDIVEAFTAMRHEWRGQTKETRALTELIQAAVTNIQSVESKLLAGVANTRVNENGSSDAADAKPLVQVIVETDHQLTRAVTAIEQWETNRRLSAEEDAKAVQRCFAGMNGLARWFARPLLTFVTERRSIPDVSTENPAIAGLDLVLTRLRRVMNEHGIERLDTEGQPFDAETMYAIGSVATADCPSGHVAEQLSPAYRWQGRILRFADVRVAK
jgi:molecular chaperone GrpE